MQKQYTTFYLLDNLYGIDVMDIQEITKTVSITPLNRAPAQVSGLINLRGRVATALSLGRVLMEEYETPEDFMTVICENEDDLYSVLVDRVGDVIELDEAEMSDVPENSESDASHYLSGIFQLEKGLLRIVNIKNIINLLNSKAKGEVA